MERIIEIPRKGIRSDYEGYNYLCSLYGDLSSLSSSIIIFDFKNVTFLEANLCAFIGAIFETLENNNNRIKVENIQYNVSTILRKNKFLIPYGYDILPDSYNTTLDYKRYSPNADREFKEYIEKQLLSRSDFPSHSSLLAKEISKNIFELYVNAITHGHCEYIHTCGQFFPKSPTKPLFFTIVDKGVTIKENVTKFLKKDMSGSDAIEWAMKSGNTTKTGSNPGGLGLGLIFEFIEKNNGKIHIVSADGYYEFSNNLVIKEKLNFSFSGTMVNLRFNLNDKNYYFLQEELKDIDITDIIF